MGIEVELRVTSVSAHLKRAHGSVRSLAVSELRILETYAEAIVEDIQAAWPVDTSTSRDAFTFTTADRENIAIVVENDADYAEYVHRKGTAPEPALWETLIPAVWDRYKVDLARELRAAVDATEALIVSERAKGKGGLTVSQVLAGKRPSRKRAA